MRPDTKRWTTEEDDVLRQEAFVDSPIAEIASKIGRSESAVRTRAHALRIPLRTVGIRRRTSAW